MNKKNAIIIVIILIILSAIIGYFAIEKVNENNRNYEIEEIAEFKYFISKINEKYGVIDSSGKTIIEATYDKVEIPNPSKEVFICYTDKKSIAVNANNKQLFAEYNTIEPIQLQNSTTNVLYEKSVLKSEKNGKYGLIDFSGNKISEPEYDKIEGFANVEGKLQIEKNGKVGVINIKGTTLVKPEYDIVIEDKYYDEENKYNRSGYIVGEKNEDGYRYGYIDYKGILKIKLEYNDISRVSEISNGEGLYLIVAKNGQYGLIKDGKNIINNEYQEIEYDKENKIFTIQKNKKIGVADISGKIIIPVENTDIQVRGEFIYAEKNNIKEVYDISGNKADMDFDKSVNPTSNANYKITISMQDSTNYYGVIGNNNKQIIKPEYLYIEYAFDNYFIVCGQNGKLGVLDSNENVMIELKYDLVQKVQGKDIIQTLLSETNTTELYSNKLKKIAEMESAILENNENYIKLSSKNDIKYYNNQGENVTGMQVFPNNSLFASCQNGKWGYVDKSGNVKVDYEYELASELNQYGYASIKKDGKWGAIDSKGNVVVEPKYELSDQYNKVEFIGEYYRVNSGLGAEYYTKF